MSREESKSQATELPDKPKLIETEPYIESTLQRLNKSEEKFLEHKRLLQDAEKGSFEQIKTLPAERFDVDVRDPYGRTLLMEAVQSGKLELVKFLIDKGADVNVKDKYGEMTLSIGSARNRSAIVRYLKAHGVE